MRVAIAIFAAIGIGVALWAPSPKSAAPVQAPQPAVHHARAATSEPIPLPAPSPSPGETLIPRSENGHFYATADVNGMPTRFVIDTGATTVALTVDDARKAGIAVDPANFRVVGTGASGEVRGQTVMLDAVTLDGRRTEGVAGAVLDGLTVSLLGQSYLSRLERVEISNDTMKLH